MIKKVTIKNFKMFGEQSFELSDNIVLAGPNNSGKSTLLQAISTWQLAFTKWRIERTLSPNEGIKQHRSREKRPGLPLTRNDFTTIPVREMNLLWCNRDTAYGRAELNDETKAGTPKQIEIRMEGVEKDTPWELTIKLRYENREMIYIYAFDQGGKVLGSIPDVLIDFNVVHIPPFSGIGAEETRFDIGYQNLLIGQGKPGDILRNLLFEVYSNNGNKDNWSKLIKIVKDLFDFSLSEPRYSAGRPYILCEYEPSSSSGKHMALDIASAGSGFHQILMILGFIFARPSSILLMDEPDAHLHIILQRQIYDQLKTIIQQRNSQLLIATHSEIILDDTDPQNIYSFFGEPHLLKCDIERDQVREALKRLSTVDILSADSQPGILYMEDESDLKILREFAKILNHPLLKFLNQPFFIPLRGRNITDGRGHFFAAKAIKPDIKGVIVLDGDNRNLKDHELVGENMTILRWKRYEIENYLLVPEAISRFLQSSDETQANLFNDSHNTAFDYLRNEFPPAAFSDPLGNHPFLNETPASKQIFPLLFEHINKPMSKRDYYQIAQTFNLDEIHPEVSEKLDAIYKAICGE
jgi:predicted ATPase